ncbi:hypothetical protein SNOG_15028 [Parastagonospora nodorum SN15]|uniref:Uncharacterized protein n=1 Tax=Phaeosphaeria nodorum (strain SN15 / ATCC MYA-4574 / FGSC 10173) TaxID=321614 RepID=Q0TZL9_PHANO|nr:hypothetical protein SNOG_15028 [Parastagonospora nodorum SN15]EAT77571.1 hypothetical protein SNOG_15028 [Parastagonospora nodorum SN15]
MSLLKKMNLKALDLYFFLPQDRDTVFAPKHFSNTLPRPALDVDDIDYAHILRRVGLTRGEDTIEETRPG